MKIFDAFIFFNELEMLKIRLNVLSSVVSNFILVEAPITHSGKEKPLYFNENKHLFSEFSDRIIHVKSNLPSEAFDGIDINWTRERAQRSVIDIVLKKVALPEDFVLVSDVDEIPNPDTLLYIIKNYSGPINFLQTAYYYKLNWLHNTLWRGTGLCRYSDYQAAERIRRCASVKETCLSGWHFSFMGGVDAIKTKIQSFAHQEFNTQKVLSNVEYNVNNQFDIFEERQTRSKFLSISPFGSLPKYISDNVDYYRKTGWIE